MLKIEKNIYEEPIVPETQ
uniref:Uncharacterized protein n=1 Tax=Globodera pallida TaxID=36090 RepID=A0A183BX81_GLOPA